MCAVKDGGLRPFVLRVGEELTRRARLLCPKETIDKSSIDAENRPQFFPASRIVICQSSIRQLGPAPNREK
jgi:hypothetical protein